METQKRILTNSASACAKTCLRKYYLKHVLGWMRDREESPLRIGKAIHLGLELRTKGVQQEDAISEATAGYDTVPEWAEPDTWAVERETVANLLAGYWWYYAEEKIKPIAVEQEYRLPLRNPETNHVSPLWDTAGKIDLLAVLNDGDPALWDHKTTSTDLSPDSEYWLRLRADQQIRMYVLGAREIGYPVNRIIYNVIRKPAISPRQIPLTDDDGHKIVHDADGQRVFKKDGSPRESGDKKKGYTLQVRTETAQEFGAHLLQDISERPEWYFARREVPCLESDLEEIETELWLQAQHLNECYRKGFWFRNVSQMTCSRCEYKSICLQGLAIDTENPPSGFAAVDWTHRELTDPDA